MLLLILKEMFPLILTQLTDLESSVNLPFMVKVKYKAINKSVEVILKSVVELRDKIDESTDIVKNEIRREGLKHACIILRTLSEKIMKVVEMVEPK